MSNHCRAGKIQCSACFILALSVFILAFSAHTIASSPLVPSEDWRYRALAELGRGGLLYEDDAARYASGIPVTEKELSASVERTIYRLNQANGDSTSVVGATAGPLKLSGGPSDTLRLSARQICLVADLVAEFGSSFSDPSLTRLPGSLPLDYEDGLALTLRHATHGNAELHDILKLTANTGSVGYPIRTIEAVTTLDSLEAMLKQAVAHQEPQAQAKMEMGVNSPIGMLAIGLSSEAAQRSTVPARDYSEPATAQGFDLSTSVQLSDILRFTASFATDDKAVERPTSTAVGVSIGEQEGSGVSVGHRVTDLAGPAPNSLRETITSVDVKYSLPDAGGKASGPDSLTVRAGYELYGREPITLDGEKNSLQATTSLAIDYRLLFGEAASLQAAYRDEHVRDLVASGAVWARDGLYETSLYGWPSEGSLKLVEGSDAVTRTVASIDFSYRLMNDASVMLGYKLIDFTEINALDPKNMATAEVTIRF